MENNGPTPKKNTQTKNIQQPIVDPDFQKLMDSKALSATDPSKNTADKFIGFDRKASQGVLSINKRYEDLAKQGKLSWGEVNPFNESKNIESRASDVQGFWNKMGNSAVGFAKLAGAGMMQSIGSSYDVKQGIDIFTGNVDADYKNWFDEVAEGMRNSAMENNPLYGAEDFNSVSYWANQVQQLGTTAGIAAHGFIEQALLSMVTAETGGAGAPLQAARLASTVRNINLAKQFAFGSLKGITEAVMNSKETYDNVFNEYINREGVTYEQATSIAKEAATTHARLESAPLVLLNGLQWMTIGKLNPFKSGGTAASLNTGFGGAFESLTDAIIPNVKNKLVKGAVGYGLNAVSESLEEGIQTGIGGYAMYQADKKHGGAEGKDLWGDYIFTHEMRDSMIGGAMGGAVFKGMGDAFSRTSNMVREKWFGQSDNKIAMYNNLTNSILAKGQADLNTIKEAISVGDNQKAERVRLRGNLNNVASALRIDMVKGDGATTAFDSYIAQMQNVLDSVRSNDQAALDKLGLTEQEDISFVKDAYSQMINDAKAYRNTFENELKSSISSDIAEEKTHYSMMQQLSQRSMAKVEQEKAETLKSIIEDNNIEEGDVQSLKLQLELNGLRREAFYVENNSEHADKIYADIDAKKAAIAELNKAEETLGKAPSNFSYLLNNENAIQYAEYNSLGNRLQYNLGTYRELYSGLGSVQQQRNRATEILKDKIQAIANGDKQNVSAVEVRNLLTQGENNNLITKEEEEKLKAKLSDIETQIQESETNASNLAKVNQQLEDTEARMNEIEEILAQDVEGTPERIEFEDNLRTELDDLSGRYNELMQARWNIAPQEDTITPEIDEQKVVNQAEEEGQAPDAIPASSSSQEQISSDEDFADPDSYGSTPTETFSLAANPVRSYAVDNLLNFNQVNEENSGDIEDVDTNFAPAPLNSLGNQVLEASKNSVRTLYDSIKLETGEAPSFELLVRDAIQQSKNKAGVEQMFNVFVHGWMANNYGQIDFNAAYDAIFANRADVVNNLLQMGLVSNPSVEEVQEVSQKESANLIETNKSNEVVIETPVGQQVAPQTNAQISKFVMKGHFLTLGNGVMFDGLGNEVVENMGSVGPFQTNFIDARAVVDPDGIKVDKDLQVRVATPEQQAEIPVSVIVNGVKTSYTSFAVYAQQNNIAENSPEWIENVPMIAYNEGTPTFFIHSPNYYNENTVVVDNYEEVIKEARKGVIEFRNKVVNNNGQLPITITKKTQGEYKKFDLGRDGVASKPIIEVDPTSSMGFLTNDSFVFYKQIGDTFVKETAQDKHFKDSKGVNRTIVNFDAVKNNSNSGRFDTGKAINVRQGANKNQNVVSEVYLQNSPKEAINLVARVLETRMLRNFGQQYSTEFLNLAKQIKDSMGLDIVSITGFETFMSMYMNENLVNGKYSEQEFAEKFNVPMDAKTPEKLYYATINKNLVFTVSNRQFLGGKSKGIVIKNFEPQFIQEMDDTQKANNIAFIKKSVADFKSSALTTPVRVKPSKQAFERLSSARKANAPIIGMDDNNNVVTIADNYMNFLMTNSNTGMKAFNIGTAQSPKFVTMVNPVVEFKVKGEGTVVSNFNLSYLGYTKRNSIDTKVTQTVSTTAESVALKGDPKTNVITVDTQVLAQQSEEDIKNLAKTVIKNEFETFVNSTQNKLFQDIQNKVGLTFNSIEEVTQFMQQMTSNTRGANELISLMNTYNDEFTNVSAKIETILNSKNIPSSFVTEFVDSEMKSNAKYKELASTFNFFVENDLVQPIADQFTLETSKPAEPSSKVESIPVELVKDVLTLGKELGLSSNDPAMQYFTDLVSDSTSFAAVGFNQEILSDLKDTNDNIAGLAINKSEQIVQFVNVMMGEALTQAGKKGMSKEALVSDVRAKLLEGYINEKKNKAQGVLNQLEAYNNNSAEFINALESLKKSFGTFQEIENDWNNIETKAMNLLNKYRGIKEVNIGNKKFDVQENDLMAQEIVDELSQDTDVLSEDQINDDNIQEKNYSKTSIEESGKNTASYNLKKFFYSIESVDRNGNPIAGFLGLPVYVGFDKVYNTIESVLSEERTVPSSFDAMIEILQNNVKSYPWLQQVIDRLTDNTVDANGIIANQQIRNEFTYNFARHALAMKFTMFSKDKKTGGWKLKIFDTNANEINRVIEQGWRNNFKNSNLVKVNLDGTYGINLAVAKNLAERYNNFSKVAPSTHELTLFLHEFGVTLSHQAVMDFVNSGNKNNQMFSPSESSQNIVSLLGSYVNRMAKLSESTNADFEMDKKYHPFGNANNALKRIISFEKKYATYATTNSFRDGQKSIYGFTQSKLATDMANDFKQVNSALRQRLLNNPYSSASYILDFLQNDEDFRNKFDVEHLGITAMKEMGKNVSSGNDITSLSNADHELTKLGMFMDLEQAESRSTVNGISTRFARMFFPTMSDKSQMLMMTAPVLNLNQLNFNDFENFNMSEDLFETVYEQLVLADLNRMSAFAEQKANKKDKGSKVTNIKGYDTSAQLFLTVPQLNNLVTPDGVRVIRLMQENPAQYDSAWFKETFGPQVKVILESQFQSRVEAKIESWKKYGFVNETKGKDGEMVMTTKFLDEKYLKSFETNTRDAVKLAAINYVINSRVVNANMYMMFAGDIAQYGTGKVSKYFYDGQIDKPKSIEDKGLGEDTYAYVVKEIIGVNLGKRLAALLAPGSKIANSVGDSYVQLFLKDVKGITTNTEFLVKTFYGTEEASVARGLVEKYNNAKTQNEKDDIANELQRHYPDLADYFDIEATDAQEYVTAQEQIDILTRQGRIDNETLNSVRTKLEQQAKAEKEGRPIPADAMLDYFELKVLMAPIKPVYTGAIEDKENGIERMLYIKTSSIPLIPQVTKGLELDKVRKFLETVQEKSGKNVRASYESGNKVGHNTNDLQMFMADGSFNSVLQTNAELDYDNSPIKKSALVLDRNNFRIQQDVPFKSAKRNEDTLSIGTQTMKLLFGDGVVDFDFDGKSGRELLQQYNDSFANIIDLKKQGLYKRLGMDKNGKAINPNSTIVKIHDLLKEEATLRGYPKQDLEALGVTQLGDGTWSFEVPIWLSMNSNRYESLLNSIVTNKLAKLKIPGNAFVVASEAGFQMQSDYEGIDQSKVIYTSSWTGSLQAANIVEENGKRTVKSAQVLLPSKFRLPNGEMFNFFEKDGSPKAQYTYRDENGVLRLNEDMIDKETLLSMTSFRIPTSSHVSISQIEVVGILPTEVGDTMIVPKNLTKQKGLDFDIDKENVYQHYHYIDANGKIRRYSASAVLGVDTEADAMELISDARDVMQQYYKSKGIERDLNNLIDEQDKLYELGVEEEHELIKSVQKLISQKGKQLNKNSVDESVVNYAKQILKVIDSPAYREKLSFNNILDIHKQVMTHPGMEEKTNKILSMDIAKSQAEFLSGLTSKSDLNDFSLTDDQYQIDKMGLGAAGKLGIGVYSNYVVFHSLIQQAPNRINLLQKTKEGVEDFKLNLFGIKSDGTLGATRTLGTGKRSVTEVLAERQNTATDNEKEQIMGKVNVNEVTINVDSLLVALGYDLVPYGEGKEVSIPYLLLSQPIIKDFVDTMRTLRSNTADFVTDANTEATNRLLEKYAVNPNSTQKDVNLANVTPEQMIQELTHPTPEIQRAVLATFNDLKKQGEQIAKAQRLLNINKDGLGKSFFEATQKFMDLESFDETIGGTINNIESLIGEFKTVSDAVTSQELIDSGYLQVGSKYIKPNTAVGHMLVNTIKVGQDFWGDLLPYNDYSLNTIFETIISNSKPGQAISNQVKTELKQEIFSELKKFLYSNYSFGFYEAQENATNNSVPSQEERRRLFMDRPNSPSLASYLNGLKFLSTPATAFVEGIEKIKDNALISRFKFNIEKNLQAPSTIEFDNSRGEAFDEDHYYTAILKLIEDDLLLPNFGTEEYSTRKLASDLIAYAFLEGGKQEATQFIKYIPMSLLKRTNFGQIVKTYNKNNIDGGLFSNLTGLNIGGTTNSPFITQFFQHNPNRAYRVDEKVLTKTSVEGVFQIEESNFSKLPEGFLENDVTYISTYNSDRNSKSAYNLYKADKGTMTYVKIDTLDKQGLNQYAMGVPVVSSIVGHLNNTETVVNPPLAVTNTVVETPQGFLSSSNSEQVTKDRYGVSEELSSIRDVINNILLNGNSMDFVPGLKSIMTEFSKYLPMSTTVVVADTFFDESGNERDLHDAGGRAVFITNPNGTGTITISKTFFDQASNQDFIKIVAHEAVHAATQAYISKYVTGNGNLRPGVTMEQVPQSVRDLMSLLTQARTMFTDDQLRDAVTRFKARKDGNTNTGLTDREIETVYGVFNLYEFAALTLTEPAFQKLMNSQKVTDSKMTFKAAIIEALKKIYTSITGLEFTPNSLLAKALDTVLLVGRENYYNTSSVDGTVTMESLFDTAKDLSIEQILNQVDEVTSTIQVSNNEDLSDPDSFDSGPAEFIFAPVGFNEDILNPQMSKDDINNKPSC